MRWSILPFMSLMHHAPWLTVVSSLLSHLKEEFVTEIMEEYEEMREDYYAGLEDRSRSADGEDVNIYETEKDRDEGNILATYCMLRQQAEEESKDPTLVSQADFIAPSGYKDHLGMFAVSCFGCDQLVEKYEV